MKATIKVLVIIISLAAAFFLGGMFAKKADRIKEDSQWKAINGNLRQFTAAGLQYLMEYGGDEVSYETLLEKEYFPEFYSIRGEEYSGLVFRKNEKVAYVQLPNTEYYVLLHY
jgi:hypothetical protein